MISQAIDDWICGLIPTPWTGKNASGGRQPAGISKRRQPRTEGTDIFDQEGRQQRERQRVVQEQLTNGDLHTGGVLDDWMSENLFGDVGARESIGEEAGR